MGGGTTIGGRYVLSEKLGAGGMATVHLARQLGAAGFARIVAVKRLHERLLHDRELVGMFLDEARIVARIRHPNVVQTIDVVAENGELFIVMEYIHGESLIRLLQAAARGGAFVPVPIATAILASVLHGLHEAHEARGESGQPLGIVHRDVSPHNILVGVDGIARVLDFGVAKASERIQTTHEGQLKGKLSYMSPEQVRNGPLDRRTDVYAAAVVLWETLTATKLIHGSSEAAVLQQVLTGDIREPSSRNPAVSRALDDVIMRGLARDPHARFASAREMALALEQATSFATTSEIGAWVAATCKSTLQPREQLIATIEAQASGNNLRQAVDSLHTLSARAEPAPASSPPFPEASDIPTISSSSVGASRPPRGPDTNPSAGRSASTEGGARRSAIGISIALVVAVSVLSGVALVVLRRPLPTTSAPLPPGPLPSISPASAKAADASPSAALLEPTCPEGMVAIPGGRFFMGSDDALPSEKPEHHVMVKAFCMDRFEVSSRMYRACSDRGDCMRAPGANAWEGLTPAEARTYDPLCNGPVEARAEHPVNCIGWAMADRFCRASGKRLPTEAEWEFAARGSDGRKFPWGDDKPAARYLNACGRECVSWLKSQRAQGGAPLYPEDDGYPTTAPVGSFPLGASRWGVEDIAGNVWEWVSDWYAPYVAGEAVDPVGPSAGTARVVRGGSWNSAYMDWARPSFRFSFTPETRSHGIGFRCAK